VVGDERFTYFDLNERANRLAALLVGAGAGREAVVGISVERSVEMVTSVLAALKAGAAYLPLDPAYPAERLAYMMKDSGAGLLLTGQQTANKLQAVEGSWRTIDLDAIAGILAASPAVNLQRDVEAGDIAYVIYTSGSTGLPKGTRLSHGALCNLLHWHAETMVTRVATLQFASIGFDVSFLEMFAALATGGTLHVVSEIERRDVDRLAAYLCRHRIVKAVLPVVVFRQLAASCATRPQSLQDLRELTTTGEQIALTPAMVELCAQLPECVLHNQYGPSETHVVTDYTFAGPPLPLGPAPIGRPIANTRLYVLDRRSDLVPVGVAGELFIAGAGLARDYLRRPDLTAERFVPDPFDSVPGARMYRTGDRARWRPDGVLEFLGRMDRQLKIRGFRIEPAAIESVVSSCPSVAEAVVVARDDDAKGPRLVAYVVPTAAATSDVDALRLRLMERIPDHEMPSAFVVVASLPLTRNGKLDRAALPAPGTTRDRYRPPETLEEALLCALFAELTEAARVGVDDNFFTLGGHSLLAMRLVNRLRAGLGVDLPVRSVFEAPTAGALAVRLAQSMS
jgi:amino acid adenylation domain-containing protein